MNENRKPTQRQIVFNWIMGEDLSNPDGYWGGREEVESIDELLIALNALICEDWKAEIKRLQEENEELKRKINEKSSSISRDNQY
jgi:hypothetical protein